MSGTDHGWRDRHTAWEQGGMEFLFGMNSEFRADFVNNVEFNAGPAGMNLTNSKWPR